MKKLNITVGCDPEFFLKEKGSKNNYISAHDIVPGTKEKPYKLDGGALQADGTAVEFNTDPAKTSKEFKDNINKVMDQIKQMIPKDLEICIKPVISYDSKYFKTLPEKATELGCDPDYNAFSGKQKTMPPNHVFYTYNNRVKRTGSGHIHLGWGNFDTSNRAHQLTCQAIANYHCSNVLRPFIRCTTTDSNAESNRWSLYGSQGAYRVKPYGVELRSLSNSWLNYPDFYEDVFTLHKRMIEYLHQDQGDIFKNILYNLGDRASRSKQTPGFLTKSDVKQLNLKVIPHRSVLGKIKFAKNKEYNVNG